MTPNLNPAQKRYLRGLAHALKPVVLVGGKGITEGVVAETAAALEIHELVKLKVAAEDRAARDLAIDRLLEATQAALVARIGHVAVFYRPRAEQPLIALPR
jgi:RNA-binding protein